MSPADEILTCATCHREARVVRINDRLLGLGHVVNPRQHHHPVRLARSGQESPSTTARAALVRSEGPARGREDASLAGLSRRRTNGTRSASDGLIHGAAPTLGASASGISRATQTK